MDKDKIISLFDGQLKKINQKDFDLNSWKQYNLILIERVFGRNSSRLAQLNKLEYHFGSWSLRDTSGDNSYILSCKKSASEIIKSCIDEINVFGLPEMNTEQTEFLSQEKLFSLIQRHSGELVCQGIKRILDEEFEIKDKVEKIKSELNYFSENTLKQILSEAIVNINFDQE
ncbi:MAG: hypothetical protein ACEPOW_01635 [Bacteroidales bacterium]